MELRDAQAVSAAQEEVVRAVLRILSAEHSPTPPTRSYCNDLLARAARQLATVTSGPSVLCTCGEALRFSEAKDGWVHATYTPGQGDWDHDAAPADRFVDGWMAARIYYGRSEQDGEPEHGAECDNASNNTYICTCNAAAERAAAVDAGRTTS